MKISIAVSVNGVNYGNDYDSAFQAFSDDTERSVNKMMLKTVQDHLDERLLPIKDEIAADPNGKFVIDFTGGGNYRITARDFSDENQAKINDIFGE